MLALLRRGDEHALMCVGGIAPPRHPASSHRARQEGHAPLLGLWPDATLEWHQKQATFQPPAREHDLRALWEAGVQPGGDPVSLRLDLARRAEAKKNGPSMRATLPTAKRRSSRRKRMTDA